MDAVTYLKTYERMKEAEGLFPFERLFKAGTSPEEKVSLVEEWGRENPEKPKSSLELLNDVVDDLNKKLFLLEVRVGDIEYELEQQGILL